jgi:hypothetical protein
MPDFLRNTFSPRNILILTFVLCGVAIGAYLFFLSKNHIDSTPVGWGELGDYVGGVVGTIIATGTVIFLLLTLNAQNKTKNDNFFFYLLQLKQTHLSSLDGVISGRHYKGQPFLRELVSECRLIHHHYSGNSDKVKELLVTAKPTLNAYMNHNVEIINFLSSSSNSIARYHSVDYQNIYVAQLTNEERIILGYFCAILPDPIMKDFYVKSRIKDLIEYEEHLLNSRLQKPDAIKEILDSLD